MAENILEILRAFAQIGESIELLIRLGDHNEVIKGQIVQFNDFGVVIKSENAILFAKSESIDNFKVIKPLGQIQAEKVERLDTENIAVEAQNGISSSMTGKITTIFEEDSQASISLELLDIKLERFNGIMNFSSSEPEFDLGEPIDDDKSELVNIKNKYEYAIKIKELNRITNLLPILVRLSNKAGIPNLFLLCGSIALKIGDIESARNRFIMAMERGSAAASIALAHLSSENKKWDAAASFLIRSLILKGKTHIDRETILDLLGNCIYHLANREIPGLATIDCGQFNEKETNLLNLVIAFALREKYPLAARYASEGNFIKASELSKDSVIYFPISGFVSPEPKIKAQAIEQKEPVELLGHVSAVYPEREFGFIIDVSQETFFFNLYQSSDLNLQKEWGENKTGQRVSFRRQYGKSIEHKYDKAINIRSVEPIGQNISTSGIKIESEKKLPSNLPKGDTFYARAKRAELLGEFGKAEKLYRLSIENSETQFQSAVKDLATLLNRKGKTQDSICLLDYYRDKIEDQKSLDNQKAYFLVVSERYTEAAELYSNLRSNSRGSEKAKLTRHEAYCHYMMGNPEISVMLLGELVSDYPRDILAKKLLDKAKAYKTGVIVNKDDEEILSLAGLSEGLSPFSQELLNLCDYSGLDEAAKARGYFTKRDFNLLKDNLDSIRIGRRPKDKAKLLLTMAAMAQRSPEAAGKFTPQHFLARCLSSMGEAAIYENLPIDTVRFYLSESLLLITGSDIEYRFPLVHLLSTYTSKRPAPGSLLGSDGRTYDITKILKIMELEKGSFESFLKHWEHYSTLSMSIMNILRSNILDSHSRLSEMLPSPTGQNQLLSEEYERQRNEKTVLKTLALQNYDIGGNFQEAAKKLLEIKNSTLFELDAIRLSNLANICLEAELYWREEDYVERESKFHRLKNGLDSCQREIITFPTKNSFELIAPVIEKIREIIISDFEAYIAKAKPLLELNNVLSNDYYLPNINGNIVLRLELSSLRGSAPVEGIDVYVTREDGLVSEPTHSPELLRGGERREIEMVIIPSAKQLAEQAFTIKCYIQYRTRAGKQEKSGEYLFPIRIGQLEEFEIIENPYREYSGGRSVDDPKIFKGREELLSKILDIITKRGMGQCFVLYGQKRSGKTSILRQIKRRISQPCLAIEITMGILDLGNNKTGFVQLCLDKLKENLEEIFEIKVDEWPSEYLIKEQPIRSFENALRFCIRLMRGKLWDDPKIILLIDEFTYIYEYIIEGILSPEFMRNWKALLEMRLFNAVLVGQDSMPKFKQRFANEFGVTYDERITYLSKNEALSLAADPILLNGFSRYRGFAFDRLFSLTAGSPFYVNIICDRLVKHLNERKAPFITEADIDASLAGLISGNDALPIEKFDPLVTAAGESVAEASRESYLNILSLIAQSRSGTLKSELAHLKNYEFLIKDLFDREIITIDASQRITIRVGLFAEWLKFNSAMAGISEAK
jgi:hypothetical protein